MAEGLIYRPGVLTRQPRTLARVVHPEPLVALLGTPRGLTIDLNTGTIYGNTRAVTDRTGIVGWQKAAGDTAPTLPFMQPGTPFTVIAVAGYRTAADIPLVASAALAGYSSYEMSLYNTYGGASAARVRIAGCVGNFFLDGVESAAGESTQATATNRWHHIAANINRASTDGNGGLSNHRLGAFHDSGWNSAVDIALYVVLPGNVSRDRLKSLSRNPWQTLRSTASPIFYSLPSAGAAHTLSGAVTESATDTATGTITYQHTLTGAVVESAADTATGAISFQHTLSGAVTESGADTASGTIVAGTDTYLSGAVVESAADAATGTISFFHSLSGAVVETGVDTASGEIAGQSTLSGAVVEGGDTATGEISNPEALVPSKGAGSSKTRRRKVVIGDRVYDVPERDIPALLEATLRGRRPPASAVAESSPAPVKPKKGPAKAQERAQEAPEAMVGYPSLDEACERYETILAQVHAQAASDVAQMLERVAQRVMDEIEDEEETLVALLLS